MCGRFALSLAPAALQAAFPEFVFPEELTPRYNIAPSQPILVLPNDGSGRADFYLWGLIPSWAKDASIGSRLINARAETLAEKPAFRDAFKYRRCLIFADGFYEWQAQPGGKVKTPYFIRLKGGKPFAFAGLWDEWHAPDGSQVKSAVIITTEANELMRPLHQRMPVILPPDAWTQWLDPAPRPPTAFLFLLRPFPPAEMEARRVSTLVNHPANDRPECILPA